MTLKRSLLAIMACAFLTTATAAVAHAQTSEYDRGLSSFKKRDYAQALAIWAPLAEAGNVSAQFNVARMYDNGIGTPEDDVVASGWYSRAAAAGFSPAQRELALDYIEGEGVVTDPAKGIQLLHQAADAGDADAQFQLGMLYREGEIVAKDYSQAMKWYLTAAAKGHSEAQYMIGFMYGSGYGVPQDFVMAYYYYSLASDKIDISVKAREHLTEYMSTDDITRAMSLVTEQRMIASTGQNLAVNNP
jgi:uncharacterized protein